MGQGYDPKRGCVERTARLAKAKGPCLQSSWNGFKETQKRVFTLRRTNQNAHLRRRKNRGGVRERLDSRHRCWFTWRVKDVESRRRMKIQRAHHGCWIEAKSMSENDDSKFQYEEPGFCALSFCFCRRKVDPCVRVCGRVKMMKTFR